MPKNKGVLHILIYLNFANSGDEFYNNGVAGGGTFIDSDIVVEK